MKINNYLLISFLFCFFSCQGQETIYGTISHDNIEREYILYVPDSYNAEEPSPLLFCFHGYGSSAAVNFGYTNFKAIADTAGFILVHPQGTLLAGVTHWNVGGWTLASTVDDVGFVDLLLDSLSNDYNLDADRVYSTGMSNGGYMSFLLACQLSDRIAAVASVTGSMTPQTYNACDPQHPTPVLQIHGTQDGTVPYGGNPVWTKSIEDVLLYWSDYNATNLNPTITPVPDINTSDGSTVEVIEYADGDNCTSTKHFKVYGGDHDWPGVFGNMDINATKEIWQFLSQYDINGLITCETTSIDQAFKTDEDIQIYPNPVSQFLTINHKTNANHSYKIYSVSGSLVMEGKLGSDQEVIDVSKLISNVYFLKIEKTVVKFIKS